MVVVIDIGNKFFSQHCPSFCYWPGIVLLSKPPTITFGKRLCKYADYTYRHLIIPACNCHCQSAEFDDGPAVSNNLHLSRAISKHKLSLLKQDVAIPSTLWWEVKPTERNPQGRSPFFAFLGQNLTRHYPVLLTLSDRWWQPIHTSSTLSITYYTVFSLIELTIHTIWDLWLTILK